jgi:hypothetical protein
MKQELADLTLLVHGIVASGQRKLALRTQTVPASTVLTNRRHSLVLVFVKIEGNIEGEIEGRIEGRINGRIKGSLYII